MSLFESASLVVTSNGVKESKLYSVKPTDGSGDLTVTRATTATRVNAAGLIEAIPYNLFQYSEQFDNSTWVKFASGGGTVAVTANYSLAPNGTLTADRLLANTVGSASIAQAFVCVNGFSHTSSIYLKSNTTLSYTYQLRDGYSGILETITITPEWQRFDLNFTSSGTTAELQLRTVIAGASDISIWGAQVVQGSVAKDYFPTTTRLNVPRLDYTNSTCPSILIEPQRTNLILRSEEFDNITWTKTAATVTPNSIISPDGTQDADTLNGDTVNSFHQAVQIVSVVNATSYTFSVFAKKGTNNFIQLTPSSAIAGVNAWGNFNLLNGTVGTIGSTTTASIVNYGNDWYRCSITFTATATVSGTVAFIIVQSATSPRGETGINNKNIYLWGAQLEGGANATSYIPTTTATVTRNADVISKTGISSLIGQTEGTLFFESKGLSDNNVLANFITFNDGTVANQIGINYAVSTGFIRGYFRVNSITNQINSNILKTNNAKVILRYNNNNYNLFINGLLIGSGTTASGFSSPLTTLKFSQGNDIDNFNGNLKQIVVFKTALTDTECINLTTL